MKKPLEASKRLHKKRLSLFYQCEISKYYTHMYCTHSLSLSLDSC